MRKSLKQLIDDEHFAILELNACESVVDHWVNLANQGTEYQKELYEAIDERDDALQELATIRAELKKYLLDIINGN